jgi:hypothetical protein
MVLTNATAHRLAGRVFLVRHEVPGRGGACRRQVHDGRRHVQRPVAREEQEDIGRHRRHPGDREGENQRPEQLHPHRTVGHADDGPVRREHLAGRGHEGDCEGDPVPPNHDHQHGEHGREQHHHTYAIAGEQKIHPESHLAGDT